MLPIEEMSKKLLLHTKIDSIDLNLNSLNGSVNNIKPNSWISMK